MFLNMRYIDLLGGKCGSLSFVNEEGYDIMLVIFFLCDLFFSNKRIKVLDYVTSLYIVFYRIFIEYIL